MTEQRNQDTPSNGPDLAGVDVEQFLDRLADAMAARLAPKIAAEIRRKLSESGPEADIASAIDDTAVAAKLPKRIKSV
ncbi:MAG: hypothetical protein RLO50_01380 [Azospirillaceae bacterium]